MTLKFVSDYIDQKLKQNSEYVVFTFYELRIKSNLSEDETDQFLALAKNKFENMKYQVFFTGAQYEYNGYRRKVEDNELMIAIPEKNY